MNRIIGRIVVVALALIVVPAGSVVLAPASRAAEPSPGATPTGSPEGSVGPSASPGASPAAVAHACDLWTAEEVSAALGGGEFTLEPASSGVPICFYVGSETAEGLTQGLYAGLIPGDPSTDSLVDQMRQNFPDAEELEIGGMVAIPGPTSPGTGQAEGWSTSTLYVFPDPMVMLELQATVPDGVDAEAALASLVELAALRIASVQPPAAAPSPSASPSASGAPAASGEARTGLAALIPADLGGSPTSIEADLTGQQFLSQIVNFQPMEQKVTKALKKRDRKVGDVSFVLGASESGSVIAAFQVKGGAIKPLVNVLLESLAMERTRGGVRPEDVAGKDAFGILGGFLIGGEGYAYPKDDVLWLVFPIPPEQTEVFEKLP